MKMKSLIILLITHLIAGAVGFAVGIYALPILTAPDAPDIAAIQSMSANASFTSTFNKDLQDSDFLHQAQRRTKI